MVLVHDAILHSHHLHFEDTGGLHGCRERVGSDDVGIG